MLINPLQEEKIEFRVLDWLTEKGYRLVKRNWEYCHGKVDIIASRFGTLHFIGIATKCYPDMRLSEQCVTRRKMLSFLQASKQYLQRNPEWKNVQIDVLTVTIKQEEPAECIFTNNLKI